MPLQTIPIDYYGAPGCPGVPWETVAALRADADTPPTPLQLASRRSLCTSPDSEILKNA